MDAGASASARPAGLPVHDARPVGCAHPASRARPAGAASHSSLDMLPALLRRLGWMMDKPKTASASLTSMVESHYGVSNLEVDWFGAAAGGVPPFDGLYSCRYDTGRRRNNGVLRVRNHRVWLYGPDGCEEERHGH